jgi:hypothetical protein
MSQMPPAVSNLDFQEHRAPIYTESAPLIWLELSIAGRHFPYPTCLLWRFDIEVVPVTPSLYAALHKVNCLVASRLAEPDAELSSCKAKWDELAALLEYVTCFMLCIQNSMLFSLRILLIRISELIVMKRWDILSLCVRETTRYMDPMDAISTVWRLECELARFEVPFYEGSTFV